MYSLRKGNGITKKGQQITSDMRSDLLSLRPLHITEPLVATNRIK